MVDGDTNALHALVKQSTAEAEGQDSAQVNTFGGPSIGLISRIGSALPSIVATAQLQLIRFNQSIRTIVKAKELGSESPLPPSKQCLRAVYLALQEVARFLANDTETGTYLSLSRFLSFFFLFRSFSLSLTFYFSFFFFLYFFLC
jgi:hypothetical protein